MKNYFLTLILLMPLFVLPVLSQEPEPAELEEEIEIVKDSISLTYKFFAGDEFIYRVKSHDSIIFDFGEPLIRDRVETLRVVCDSVDTLGQFHLTLTNISYSAIESDSETKGVERNSSAWTNRNVYLVLDSLVNRISVQPDNYNLATIAPGGVFQSYLFFPLKEQSKAVNESWFVSSKDSLYENGVPAGELDHKSLFRAQADIDTLGHLCSRVQFVRTATGDFLMLTSEGNIASQTVINAGGFILLSKDLQVPVYLFQTNSEKLKVFFPDKSIKVGTQNTTASFQLISFKRQK